MTNMKLPEWLVPTPGMNTVTCTRCSATIPYRTLEAEPRHLAEAVLHGCAAVALSADQLLAEAAHRGMIPNGMNVGMPPEVAENMNAQRALSELINVLRSHGLPVGAPPTTWVEERLTGMGKCLAGVISALLPEDEGCARTYEGIVARVAEKAKVLRVYGLRGGKTHEMTQEVLAGITEDQLIAEMRRRGPEQLFLNALQCASDDHLIAECERRAGSEAVDAAMRAQRVEKCLSEVAEIVIGKEAFSFDTLAANVRALAGDRDYYRKLAHTIERKTPIDDGLVYRSAAAGSVALRKGSGTAGLDLRCPDDVERYLLRLASSGAHGYLELVIHEAAWPLLVGCLQILQLQRPCARCADFERARDAARDQLAAEAFDHAACLTIAEGTPGWREFKPTRESHRAVIALRNRVEELERAVPHSYEMLDAARDQLEAAKKENVAAIRAAKVALLPPGLQAVRPNTVGEVWQQFALGEISAELLTKQSGMTVEKFVESYGAEAAAGHVKAFEVSPGVSRCSCFLCSQHAKGRTALGGAAQALIETDLGDCAVCGAKFGQPCTQSCNDSKVPDAKVKKASITVEHTPDSGRGIAQLALAPARPPPPKREADIDLGTLADLLADDAEPDWEEKTSAAHAAERHAG